jgi:ribokinase
MWAAHASGGIVFGQVNAVAVEAVDSTGAGDAFVGALAAELASGVELADAVAWAAAAASASVRTAGTHASYADRAAVSALLKSISA